MSGKTKATMQLGHISTPSWQTSSQSSNLRDRAALASSRFNIMSVFLFSSTASFLFSTTTSSNSMCRSSPTKQGSGEARGDKKTEANAEELEADAEELEADAEETTGEAEETADRQ